MKFLPLVWAGLGRRPVRSTLTALCIVIAFVLLATYPDLFFHLTAADSGGAIAVAVLIEALLLALLGAATGVAISYGAFNGVTINMLGDAVFDLQLV